MRKTWVWIALGLLLAACSRGEVDAPMADETLSLTSPVFEEGLAIPSQYTCQGEDFSPALNWGEPPAGTQSFALIMDDPDAPLGTWVHWVLYDLPGEARGLEEAASGDGVPGVNSSKNEGYNGPCPPSGEHRYFFKLYALDTVLDAEPGLDKEALLDLMEGHVLAEGRLMGVYAKGGE